MGAFHIVIREGLEDDGRVHDVTAWDTETNLETIQTWLAWAIKDFASYTAMRDKVR